MKIIIDCFLLKIKNITTKIKLANEFNDKRAYCIEYDDTLHQLKFVIKDA